MWEIQQMNIAILKHKTTTSWAVPAVYFTLFMSASSSVFRKLKSGSDLIIRTADSLWAYLATTAKCFISNQWFHTSLDSQWWKKVIYNVGIYKNKKVQVYMQREIQWSNDQPFFIHFIYCHKWLKRCWKLSYKTNFKVKSSIYRT